jgi:hypothetical protein
MMTDYKSKELNIFSGVDVRNKLRGASENNTALESDVFKFKYGLASQDGKGDVTGNMPIYIPKLAADVGGTAVYISDWLWQDRQTIAAEQARALAAESVLRSDTKVKYDTNALAISQEVTRASAADSKHASDIASETLAREQADSQLTTALALEDSARRAGDTALSGLIATNKGVYDAYVVSNDAAVEGVHVRISSNHTYYQQRFANLDSAIRDEAQYRENAHDSAMQVASDNQALTEAETARATSSEAGLQTQISNLLANTDAVALNSLAELVADYRLNGSGVSSSVSALTDRVAYLEGVITMLVAKSV